MRELLIGLTVILSFSTSANELNSIRVTSIQEQEIVEDTLFAIRLMNGERTDGTILCGSSKGLVSLRNIEVDSSSNGFTEIRTTSRDCNALLARILEKLKQGFVSISFSDKKILNINN